MPKKDTSLLDEALKCFNEQVTSLFTESMDDIQKMLDESENSTITIAYSMKINAAVGADSLEVKQKFGKPRTSSVVCQLEPGQHRFEALDESAKAESLKVKRKKAKDPTDAE